MKVPCKEADKGYIVLGGTTSVKVPKGSYMLNCSDGGACIDFEQCPSGWYGATPANRECKACAAGLTSSDAATDCKYCVKGKFGEIQVVEDEDGGSGGRGGVCTNCQPGYFQPDEKGATECAVCPAGYTQDNEGVSLCIDKGGIKPEACKFFFCMYIDVCIWTCKTTNTHVSFDLLYIFSFSFLISLSSHHHRF